MTPPQVIVRSIDDVIGDSPFGLFCVASDGVWDHWTFEAAVADLVPPADAQGVIRPPDEKAALDFFERTRYHLW